MNGAEHVIRFLMDKGVDYAFGYPGGPVLVLYDAIYRLGFPHWRTRHEQGAVHAAEGYARVSGKPGVCIATSGPGATNLVTGIANAYLDSTPLLCITGAVNRRDIGRDAFQEADITGITDPITKYNYLVMEPNQLVPILEEAWELTTSGRPGPVLVNIPKDILALDIDKVTPTRPFIPHRPKPQLSADVMADIIAALEASRKPLLLVGGGVIHSEGAPAELARFLDRTHMPVTTTLMGKGSLPTDHPDYLQHVGMHGTVQSNQALGNCDLLLAVGTRFSDRVVANPVRYSHGRKVIHVDIDSSEIGKNVPTDIEVEDDAGNFFRELNAALATRPDFAPAWAEWRDHLAGLAARYNELVIPLYEPSTPLKSQYVVKHASRRVAGMNPICVTDVGQHQMFAAQHFDVESPRSFITSGGLGTMGFGLPAAIGAAKAAPDRPVIAFVGDGGIQMTIQELGTLAEFNLHVIVLILDNQTLGMVRQWQELFFNEHYAASLMDQNPDFVKIAEAYGVRGSRVATPEEYDRAFDEALAERRPYLMHIRVPKEDNVYPMIPAGRDPQDLIMPGMVE
ncbi:MAG: biosynthetic-type acetolactate synthase large subunit [Bacillota bacterium]|nr:biosynthetic-type acetolactate synthase large subunit [Bacillota bacterium]